MDKINEVIEFLENIQKDHIINVIIGILIFVIFRLISSKVAYVIIKIFNMKSKNKKIKDNGLYKPLKYAIISIGAYLGILCIGFPSDIMQFINKIFKVIIIVLIANGAANLLTPKSKLMRKIKESDRIDVNDKVTDFAGKVIRTIIYIIAGFMIAYEFGYNLTGVITGLGIGSVVIALAAQDIAKNLCSGVVLLMDKPFGIGEYIKVTDFEGTVEDITFRAVRIRTLEGTVVTIPNSKISEGSIINYSRIEERRCVIDLGITLETKIERINKIEQEIRNVLERNDYVIKDKIEVNVKEILDSSININIFFYTKMVKYIDFLHVKDVINKELMELIEKEKIDLAYDTKTIYVH